VALDQSIRVQFDRFLAPTSPVRQAICVESVSVGSPEAGPDRCLNGSLSPQYDPVDRVAVWKPTAKLDPNTRYNVKLLAPADENDPYGIRAFDGAPLEGEPTFAFTTGDGSNLAVEPKRHIGFCDVPQQLCQVPAARNMCKIRTAADSVGGPFRIFSGCTDGNMSCHGSAPSNYPPLGGVLQLETTTDIRRLVEQAQVATETATGPDPAVAQRSVGTPFGVNMPYIDAKNPGNSYLLYKVILASPPRCPLNPDEESAYTDPVNCSGSGYESPSGFASDLYDCAAVPDAGPTADGGCAAPPPSARKVAQGDLIPTRVEPFVPPNEWHAPAPGEYARLRQRIRGEPMPFGGSPSPRAWAANLSAWIGDGAVVEECGTQ
jgi:hypothetical protein